MDKHINQHAPGAAQSGLRARMASGWERRRGLAARLRRNPLMGAAVLFAIASSIYWLFLASDRYVSDARVIVQQTDLETSATPDLGSLLTGDTSGNRQDQLLMRDYLLSRGLVAKLDEELKLRDHFSQWTIDPFSRLSFANSSEDFYEYFLTRVNIEYDEFSGILVVEAQAFDPEMSHRIATRMIEEGEVFMNATARALAADQVDFLQGQVQKLNERAQEARSAVLAFQNRERIASPEAQAQSITQIVAQLESRRSELQVQLASQSAFLVDDHPVLVELRRQIAAIDNQIAQQNARLAGPRGGTLNSKMETYERLEAEALFAEELYRTAMASLEKGQVESTRVIKTLSIIQQPNTPQEAELPDRWRMSILFAIIGFLVAGVLQMLVMIIRDHRD